MFIYSDAIEHCHECLATGACTLSAHRHLHFTFGLYQSGSYLAMLFKYRLFCCELRCQFSLAKIGFRSMIRFAIVPFSFETRNNSRRRFSWLRLEDQMHLASNCPTLRASTFSHRNSFDYRSGQLFSSYWTSSLTECGCPVRLFRCVPLVSKRDATD